MRTREIGKSKVDDTSSSDGLEDLSLTCSCFLCIVVSWLRKDGSFLNNSLKQYSK